MRKLIALMVVPLLACGGGDESGQLGEAPVEEVPPETASYSPESALGPGSPNAQRLTVMNPLTEPVKITATWGGTTQALGTILPHVDGEFFIQAPAGTEVELHARSEDGQEFHRTVVLGDPISWTLGDGSGPP